MSDHEAPARSRPFWLVYAAAWLPYYLMASVAGVSTGAFRPLEALAMTGLGTVPMALAGLVVIRASRALPWPPSDPLTFAGLHFLVAVGFAVTSVFTTYGLLILLERVREGEWKWSIVRTEVVPWELLMGGLVYCVIASITYGIQISRQLREQQARTAQAAALQARAELKALRAQLNPHFLFNTLHALLALVRRDPTAAEDGIQQFGDLLRQSLRVQEDGLDGLPLSEEWEFVMNYLALERLRLGDRLRLETDVDEDALDVIVPAFCLQPLVENAIRHGIAPRSGGGALSIRGRLERDRLVLEVADDGPGADASDLDTDGLGLRLVRDRLRMLHGDQARLTVDTGDGKGFRVRVVMPIPADEGTSADGSAS